MSERPKAHQRLASSIGPSNTFWPLMTSRRLENCSALLLSRVDSLWTWLETGCRPGKCYRI